MTLHQERAQAALGLADKTPGVHRVTLTSDDFARSLCGNANEKLRARAEHRAALETLTEHQRDDLDAALRRHDNSLMSTRLALEWMFKEAVRRGWLLGPA